MHNCTMQGPRGARAGHLRRARSAAVPLALSFALLAGFVPSASAGPLGPAGGDDDARSASFQRVTSAGSTSGQSPTVGTTRAFVGQTAATIPTVVTPAELPIGSVVRNPATNRREVVVPDIRRTAVLIGDSQSDGPGSWPQLALKELGYTVSFAGAGGTGFVATNPHIGADNYYDAFTSNAWVLPHGDPALVVVEGGGNDAWHGATDGDILASANALILGLERTYPSSRMVLIGTLGRSAEDDGGRRNEVDALLGHLAEKRGIPFVSPGDWLTTHGLKSHLADEVHLSPEGSRRAAEVLERDLSALKLGADYTAVDPATRWTPENRPLE